MDNKEGITLMALVISIIVLLILSGVSIATIIGDNGIVTKALQAQKNTITGDVYERVSLAILEAQAEGDGAVSYDILENKLNQYVGDEYTISSDDYGKLTISVDTDGGIVTNELPISEIDFSDKFKNYFKNNMQLLSAPEIDEETEEEINYTEPTPIQITDDIEAINLGFDFEENANFILIGEDVYEAKVDIDNEENVTVIKTDIDIHKVGTKDDTVNSITRITDPDLVVVEDINTATRYGDEETGYLYVENNSAFNKWGVFIRPYMIDFPNIPVIGPPITIDPPPTYIR